MTGKHALVLFTTAALGYYAMKVVRNVAGAQEGTIGGDLMQIGGVAGGLLLAPKVLKVAGI